MNKKIRYILLILTLIFIGNSEVLANAKTDCANDDDCVVMCAYENNREGNNAKSYIFYEKDDNKFYVYGTGIDRVSGKTIDDYNLLSDSTRKLYMEEEGWKNLKNTGDCPIYGYVGIDSSDNNFKFCFGDSKYCEDTQNKKVKYDEKVGEKQAVERQAFRYSQTVSESLGNQKVYTIYNKMELVKKYMEDNLFNCKTMINYSDDEQKYNQVYENMEENIKTKFFSKKWDSLPDFVIAGMNEFKDEFNTKFSSEEYCKQELENQVSSGEISDSEYTELSLKLKDIETNYGDLVSKYNDLTGGNSSVGISGAVNCNELIGGSKLMVLMNKGFSYIYIIVPILVILLGMIDFGKAAFASKEDEMQKAKSRFIKRVIMGVAVFLVPTLLNVLFYIVNEAKSENGGENYFDLIRGEDCIDEVTGG